MKEAVSLEEMARKACSPPFNGGRMGVALSGGRDSMALLSLLHESLGDSVVALHVDHGLRSPESRREENDVVKKTCESLGVDLLRETLGEPVPRDEAGLREHRYRLLAKMG
ncbi:MAG: hypothetical protein HQL31_08475, partial [Planctomycetes bacterium]|nr:hypothetical protein [Planctomycetota bacterium]